MCTRGYRPLVVAGQRFRWRCDFNYVFEYHSVALGRLPPDMLLVRSEEYPHAILTVKWDQFRFPLVTPQLVRACVEEAARWGWPDAVSTLRIDDTGIWG